MRPFAAVLSLLAVAAAIAATALASSAAGLTLATQSGESGRATRAAQPCATQRTKLKRFDRQRAKKLRDYKRRVRSAAKRRAFVKRQAAERQRLKRSLDRCRKTAATGKGTTPPATPTPTPGGPSASTAFNVFVTKIEGRGRIQAHAGDGAKDVSETSAPGASVASPRARLSTGSSAATIISNAGADYTLRRTTNAAGQETIEFTCTASVEANYTGFLSALSLLAEGECDISFRILIKAPTTYRLERSASSAPDPPRITGTPQAFVGSSLGDAPQGRLEPGEYTVGGTVRTAIKDTEVDAFTKHQEETATITLQLDLSPAPS